jgi:hypothetical protein
MQTYARAHKLPLDVMMFMTEVTTKTVEQITEPAPLGSYIHGLFLEGARCVCVWGGGLGGGAQMRGRLRCMKGACTRLLPG